HQFPRAKLHPTGSRDRENRVGPEPASIARRSGAASRAGATLRARSCLPAHLRSLRPWPSLVTPLPFGDRALAGALQKLCADFFPRTSDFVSPLSKKLGAIRRRCDIRNRCGRFVDVVADDSGPTECRSGAVFIVRVLPQACALAPHAARRE